MPLRIMEIGNSVESHIKECNASLEAGENNKAELVGQSREILSSKSNIVQNCQLQTGSMPNVSLASRNVEKPKGIIDKAKAVLSKCFSRSTSNVDDAKKILQVRFKGRDFDFKKFAKINGLDINEDYIPHSNNVVGAFSRMLRVADQLLSSYMIIHRGFLDHIYVRLNADDVILTDKNISELDGITDDEKAYKLYGELTKLIFGCLNNILTKDKSFVENKRRFLSYHIHSDDLLDDIFSLPVANIDNGIGLCARALHLSLTSHFFDIDLNKCRVIDPKLDCYEKNICDQEESHDREYYEGEFKKLGVRLAFKTEELAKNILPAAKYLVSIGVSLPLFIAEFKEPDEGEFDAVGLSNDIGVVLLAEASSKDFYHECTHYVRCLVGAMDFDESISRKNLESAIPGLKDNTNLINAIKDQISEYALTDSEEYIAEFSSRVLYRLEQSENPFNYIKDERLWRLYYEFGGPDFAPIIQQKGFLPAGYDKGCDILSDKKRIWCSGYPEKFGVDINQIKDQQVEVEGMTAIGQRSFVKIDEKTVLPPPPLGYCYTTENGKLQLKIDKTVLQNSTDNTLYDPVFCSLTDGPLTLMSTEPQFVHHFELLPEESSGVLEELKHINEVTTSNSAITAIGSTIGTIVRLPVTAVQWGFSWFSPSN